MITKLSTLVIGIIERIIDKLGRMGSWFTLVMVLVMVLIVLLRYLFQVGSIALQETITYLNALIFTFGVAYTLKEDAHVRVDVAYNRFSERTRALIDMVGSLILLPLTTGFIFWSGWDYVAVSWQIREGSAESSGLPFVYILKSAILVIPLLMLIQGVAEFLKSSNTLRKA
jgi:TRAP-type mannitol/chloroaromatic compound transport system permease small subunit